MGGIDLHIFYLANLFIWMAYGRLDWVIYQAYGVSSMQWGFMNVLLRCIRKKKG